MLPSLAGGVSSLTRGAVLRGFHEGGFCEVGAVKGGFMKGALKEPSPIG